MRRGDQAPRAFQAPVDVHASADGQVYMFKRRSAKAALCSEEEELSSLELRSYHSHPNHSSTQVLERELQPGDNLNKLALQYGCQVTEERKAPWRSARRVKAGDVLILPGTRGEVQLQRSLQERDQKIEFPEKDRLPKHLMHQLERRLPPREDVMLTVNVEEVDLVEVEVQAQQRKHQGEFPRRTKMPHSQESSARHNEPLLCPNSKRLPEFRIPL